tara:strand:- start:88 stop:402 length:315 start_codon:yes stop_codon:yes gene_type:complete
MTLKKRSPSAIGKANRTKGHRSNSLVRDLLLAKMGGRAVVCHRADGDPYGADVMWVAGDHGLAFQVKSMKQIYKCVLDNLSEDGLGVMVGDDGAKILLIRADDG